MIFAPVIRRAAFGATPRSIDQTLERMFADTLFMPATQSRGRGYAVSQDDKAYTAQIDVPGLTREQLSISIEGALVRVQSSEGAPRRFQAAYELPQDINVADSTAKLENGVLTLTLAKQQPENKVSQLAIQ